ncbi:MAG: hypothetical protein ACFB2X_09060, partial [Rivularia sp. (in: cyanobacteria)]
LQPFLKKTYLVFIRRYFELVSQIKHGVSPPPQIIRKTLKIVNGFLDITGNEFPSALHPHS